MFTIALWPAFLVFAAFALVLANGVFVAAEFAIVRVRRTRLEELAGQGIEAAKTAIVLVDHVSEYLAVTQIGITAASLGVGWFGEGAFAHLFIWLLPDHLIPSAVLHVAAAIVAFLFITMIQVVVGELVPKNLAIRNASSRGPWTERHEREPFDPLEVPPVARQETQPVLQRGGRDERIREADVHRASKSARGLRDRPVDGVLLEAAEQHVDA